MEHKLSQNIAGHDIEMSTGVLAQLSSGAVKLQVGGTVILATADIDQRETELDYFPLGVEYIERLYASGNISGSRFTKEEGHPSEDAVIKARQIDHSIRSLFPKGFKRAVSVIITVLSYDGENDPETLSVLGASVALSISAAPFFGPCASVIAGITKEGEIVINPKLDQKHELEAEFVLSGTSEKFLNIEGWANEVPEEKMNEVLDKSLEVIKELNAFQMEFAKDVSREKFEYSELPTDEELIENIKSEKYDEIKAGLYLTEKKPGRREAIGEVKKQMVEKYVSDDTEYTPMDVDKAVEYIARKILRDGVLNEEKRVSGRGLEEIRSLTADVDVLPTVHGTGLFSRGLTQALSITTLASPQSGLHKDDMGGESIKRFMHRYNMPNYTVGEAGRYNYRPGRREVGHSAIAENALRCMIPSQEEFPYTIRVVSEIMTSNGSTSMAATCGTSLSLMAAGVPIKKAVAGIGVGLVTEDQNEDNYKLLLDIEGIEDFYGDMDFKLTGTDEGVTAIQYENKLKGVKPEVLKEAFQLAKTGRMQLLDVMNSTISSPRPDVAETAPKVIALQINPDRIGELIGPGGSNIKGLISSAGGEVEIDVEEDGRVLVTSVYKDQADHVVNAINLSMEEPEVGKIYEGVIDKIMDFGAFVNVTSSITGLIHVSEMSDKFVKDPREIVKEGQQVKVKLIKYENGKQSFSMKAVE